MKAGMSRVRLEAACLVMVLAGTGLATAAQTPTGTLRIAVTAVSQPVPNAEVRVGNRTLTTSPAGEASVALPPGTVTVVVSAEGLVERTLTVVITAGAEMAVVVELQARPTISEEVVVTATRFNKRLQDEPLRVEVLSRDEIEEKLLMTPGDIAMLLSETTGLRVQVTAPGLGAASLRIQGLRGRYTQLLSDGLPLYGGQSGSIGLLQIPPMDLGQVEVIKGVASSLYGASALGGVVNLVSRRPTAEAEHEALVNQTSQGQTNALVWLSGPMRGRWGYTFLGGLDRQARHDVDGDGWADVAGFSRVSMRPRVSWDNGAGKSVFFTAGVMGEDRRGGTLDGRVVPDGSSFLEALESRRTDVGGVARWLVRGSAVASVRASFVRQRHRHAFGDTIEHDVQRTGFGELSVTGTRGAHTWVLGGALQGDAYRAADLPRFNYTFRVPSAFAQDEWAVRPWMTLSASARVDAHSAFGVFASPRLSALFRARGGWTLRASAGTGYFAPTPLTDETDGSGLTRLQRFSAPDAERARSYSADANRRVGPVELNLTAFGSRVTNPLAVRPSTSSSTGYDLGPLVGPTRTSGGEALARLHRASVSVVATYTYVRSTEPDRVTGMRGDVSLTPRHAAGLTAMWEREGVARIGVEAYFTGRQALESNPYRTMSPSYPYFGALVERRFGRLRVFVNAENLTNRRQTRVDPLVRPTRNFDGRWTVDAWGPLEGRTVNVGIRVKF
jgi:iron complex outermembrane receptor protein